MIDIDKLSKRAAGLSAMRYFPSKDDAAGRLEICKAIAGMAGTWERAVWIIDQMLAIAGEWPGIPEMRGVFCLRFPPADGIDGESKLCPGGSIPSGLRVGAGFAGTQSLALPSVSQVVDNARSIPELKSLAIAVRKDKCL